MAKINEESLLEMGWTKIDDDVFEDSEERFLLSLPTEGSKYTMLADGYSLYLFIEDDIKEIEKIISKIKQHEINT
jgi:hypothetical protein